MLVSLRNAFFAGLFVLAPIAVTLFVIQILVDALGSPTSRAIFFFVPEEVFENRVFSGFLSVLATLYVLIGITIVGYFSRIFVGRLFVQMTERVIVQVPFASIIYKSVKQIVDTFSQQKRAVFQKVVLIEWPQPGNYVIGFLTGEGKGEVQVRTAQAILNIFVPTTPNPTSGYLILVPEARVTHLDMTVAEGMKLIISGGAVVPPWSKQAEVGAGQPVPVANPHPVSFGQGQPGPAAG